MADGRYGLVIFEDSGWRDFLPLVYWRGVSQLRCGYYSLAERICRVQDSEKAVLFVRKELRAFLGEQFGDLVCERTAGRTLFVNGRLLLEAAIGAAAGNVAGELGGQVAWVWADDNLAKKLTADVFLDAGRLAEELEGFEKVEASGKLMRYGWDLVGENGRLLASDFIEGGVEGKVYEGAHLVNRERIWIGEGAVVKPGAVIDAEDGPVYVGAGTMIGPNCTIQGPSYFGANCLVQPNAVIREGCNFGAVCKLGGEIEETIIQGYSNKQHNGFLGHSYLGSWINLGAETVNSDLKNTYGYVSVDLNGLRIDTGRTFVGLTMGDFGKSGINTAFGTGAVVGFGSILVRSGIISGFVPSFRWYSDDGMAAGEVEKLLAVAEKVMARRKVVMTEAMKSLFRWVGAEASRLEEG